jgi:hypothetical protein
MYNVFKENPNKCVLTFTFVLYDRQAITMLLIPALTCFVTLVKFTNFQLLAWASKFNQLLVP